MKKNRNLSLTIAAGGAALILCQNARAAYVGLQVTHQFVEANGTPRSMYRVYAQFTDANDYLTTVYGSPTLGAMVIESRNGLNTAPGGNFLNFVTSHGNAPTPNHVHGYHDPKTVPIPPIPYALYDTFFTIGVGADQLGSGQFGSDETGNQSMSNNFVPGNAFTTNNAGWFTNGPAEQGRAGWLGDGDAQLRVLIMQLTVNTTSGVRSTVNIAGIENTGLAGGQTFIASQQTFSSFIPGPGVLFLFGAGSIFASRRRRI